MISSCTYVGDVFFRVGGKVSWAETSVEEKFSVPMLLENDGIKASQDFYLEKFGLFTIMDYALWGLTVALLTYFICLMHFWVS